MSTLYRRRSPAGRRPAMAALLVAAFLLAAGCGSSDSTSTGSTASKTTSGSADKGKKVNLAMFLVATANTHQQAALKGAQKAVAEDGNATIRAFNGNFDPATQAKQIDDSTATGQYNALLVDSVDGTQTVPAIRKALNQGLTVVCGFTICGTQQDKFQKALPVAAQISTNYAPIGDKAAKLVIKACEGSNPCNVVYLQGVSVLAAEQVFTKPFLASLKTASNVKIVAKPQGKYDTNASYEAMKPVIQAHPDVDVVIAVGDQEASGAARAIAESPLKDKGVKIIGSGASVIAKREVEAGKWYASAILRPFDEGYLEAKYAIAAARGKPMSPDTVDTGPAPGFPNGFITKENAKDWRAQWAG
jgi:ribose transport system substrate-binding protein